MQDTLRENLDTIRKQVNATTSYNLLVVRMTAMVPNADVGIAEKPLRSWTPTEGSRFH